MNAAPSSAADRLALDGSVALVTGAAGGIGSAVVTHLLDAGAAVAASDMPGRTVPDGALALEADLRSPGAASGLADAIEKRYDRLDLLVHCAGITQDGMLWKLSDEAWDAVLDVNLGSAFRLLRATAPLMRRQGSGAVVLVGSINGERGKLGQSNYAASKAGLLGLGRTAARELGRFGIRVNIVEPGMIRTAMTEALADEHVEAARAESPLGRLGEPDDVAAAVHFLLSHAACHVTGQVLRVDGGQLIA